MNDFETDLAWSVAATEEDFWEAVYRKAFPGMVGHIPNPEDGGAQRNGIDRHIFLSNGKTIDIDEKKRREVWEDIALEFVSNDRTGAPGWIEKDLSIDYLAYAFMPIKKCYLLPWVPLRRAWLQHGASWKGAYRIVKAPNRTYTTLSVAVPIKELYAAVGNALRIDVSDQFEGVTF